MTDLDDLRRARWAAQRLEPREGSGDPVAVVRALGAVQSQDPRAASLTVRARGGGPTADDVEHARVEARTLVRTWVQRSTIHLVATEDVGWMQRLLRPTLQAGRQRNFASLGLDEDTDAAFRRLVRDGDGPATKEELAARATAAGLDLEGSRLTHLITRAALDGELCDGPDRGRTRTWVPLQDWVDVPEGPSGAAALAELARRHLAGYGPAEPRDLATWSGLSVRDARAAWALVEPELRALETPLGTRWVLAADDPRERLGAAQTRGTPRLLGGFDAWLLGYADRAPAVPPPHTVSAGGLRVLPAVAVDGLVVGTWALTLRRRSASVAITPFDDVDTALLADEVTDVGRFLGVAAALG